jgi:hypothetical protein
VTYTLARPTVAFSKRRRVIVKLPGGAVVEVSEAMAKRNKLGLVEVLWGEQRLYILARELDLASQSDEHRNRQS